jgi:Ca2+-binding EF-hand superfamily protein
MRALGWRGVWQEEPPNVYLEWMMESLECDNPRRIKFSEYVNLVTVLAMMEKSEASRFIFGMLDSEKTGFVGLDKFMVMVARLKDMDHMVPVKKMERLFRRFCDKFGTVNFDMVS